MLILIPQLPSFPAGHSNKLSNRLIFLFEIGYLNLLDLTNMKIRLSTRFKKILACNAANSEIPSCPVEHELDLREEYANAFRTESYNDFWMRVLALSNTDSVTYNKSMNSTTAARLPSYRLFAEHLLDPDQPTVTRILKSSANPILLFDYFAQTANASLLCGALLKDIDLTRANYRTTLKSFETRNFSLANHLSMFLTQLAKFSNSFDPFMTSDSSPRRLQVVQVGCSDLLKRLEFSRDKVHAKLRLINKLKFGSAISLVALTVTLTVIVLTHAVAVLVAAPGLLVASMELATGKKLDKLSAQLDIAAKGTYILSRDLDTISRLVTRLSDELEHTRRTAKFWLKRGSGDKAQAVGEVARQLKKNESSFSQQMDELEEHLYLCFMTINRARNLVVKEITRS